MPDVASGRARPAVHYIFTDNEGLEMLSMQDAGITPDGPVVIREAGAGDLAALEPLWRSLYDHQRSLGMLVRIPDDGFGKWQAGLAPALGRFACVMIAERGGTPLGFVAGRVRPHPAYLGGASAAYLSEVFVGEAARGLNLGRRLLNATGAWFASRDIQRLELNVIPGNTGGLAFYEKLGWVEDHRQMVLHVDASGQ